MASKNLKKCIPLLEALSSIKDPKKRQIFLHTFETNLQRAIREISYNLLHGNIKLSEEDKKRVRKYKKVLRLLADQKTKRKKFRSIVNQTGRGFLPAIIPLVVSAISSLL